MLQTQYRMHPTIAHYPSTRFYHSLLRTDPSVSSTGSHWRPYHSDISFRPLVFHNVSHGRERLEGYSMANDAEVFYNIFVLKILFLWTLIVIK